MVLLNCVSKLSAPVRASVTRCDIRSDFALIEGVPFSDEPSRVIVNGLGFTPEIKNQMDSGKERVNKPLSIRALTISQRITPLG